MAGIGSGFSNVDPRLLAKTAQQSIGSAVFESFGNLAREIVDDIAAKNEEKLKAQQQKQSDAEQNQSSSINREASIDQRNAAKATIESYEDDLNNEEDDIYIEGERVSNAEESGVLFEKPNRSDFATKKQFRSANRSWRKSVRALSQGANVNADGIDRAPNKLDYNSGNEYRTALKTWKRAKRAYIQAQEESIEDEIESNVESIADGIRLDNFSTKQLKRFGENFTNANTALTNIVDPEITAALSTAGEMSKYTGTKTQDILNAVNENPDGVRAIKIVPQKDGSVRATIFNPIRDTFTTFNPQNGIGKYVAVMLPGEVSKNMKEIRDANGLEDDAAGNAQAFQIFSADGENRGRFNEFVTKKLGPDGLKSLASQYASKDTNNNKSIDPDELNAFSSDELFSVYSGVQSQVTKDANLTSVKNVVNDFLGYTNVLKSITDVDEQTGEQQNALAGLANLLPEGWNVEMESRDDGAVINVTDNSTATPKSIGSFDPNQIDDLARLIANDPDIDSNQRQAILSALEQRRDNREAVAEKEQNTLDQNAPVLLKSKSGDVIVADSVNNQSLFRGNLINPDNLEALGRDQDDIDFIQQKFSRTLITKYYDSEGNPVDVKDPDNLPEGVVAKEMADNAPGSILPLNPIDRIKIQSKGLTNAYAFYQKHGFVPSRLLDNSLSGTEKKVYYDSVIDNPGLAFQDDSLTYDRQDGDTRQPSWNVRDNDGKYSSISHLSASTVSNFSKGKATKNEREDYDKWKALGKPSYEDFYADTRSDVSSKPEVVAEPQPNPVVETQPEPVQEASAGGESLGEKGSTGDEGEDLPPVSIGSNGFPDMSSEDIKAWTDKGYRWDVSTSKFVIQK